MLRPGRLVKLNQQTLTLSKGKDYAEVVFFGDTHYGAKCCEVDKAQAMLDYCLKNKIYILGMGDWLESATKGSVGAGVYEQTMNPQDQLDYVIEIMQPLADAGLLLGLLRGNHEGRILNGTSIDLIKLICGILRVPFLHGACWNLFKVGKQNYTCYAIHGNGGARFAHTKLAKVARLGDFFHADIVAHGHVHQLSQHLAERQSVDLRSKTIVTLRQYLILTGHYLNYFHSYAQDAGMPPSKTGSPKAKLYASKHDVSISF